MSDLPDEFNCTMTNWEYIYGLCRDVSDQVKASEFDPDVVVALARGGWFAGRCLCDFLGLNDLTSLKVEHYVGTAERSESTEIRYPLPDGSVEGKNVLIVDDIVETGGSFREAADHISQRDPAAVRSASLQVLPDAGHDPDYVGEQLEQWAWVVYPWNFIEDMVDIVSGVMKTDGDGPYSRGEIRRLLAEYHEVERIQMEIVQPDRLDEVLEEMVRRDVLAEAGDGEWELRAES
jgi:hypoxanthine phosphoribosyltransferase